MWFILNPSTYQHVEIPFFWWEQRLVVKFPLLKVPTLQTVAAPYPSSEGISVALLGKDCSWPRLEAWSLCSSFSMVGVLSSHALPRAVDTLLFSVCLPLFPYLPANCGLPFECTVWWRSKNVGNSAFYPSSLSSPNLLFSLVSYPSICDSYPTDCLCQTPGFTLPFSFFYLPHVIINS